MVAMHLLIKNNQILIIMKNLEFHVFLLVELKIKIFFAKEDLTTESDYSLPKPLNIW